jgi:hypothetical protein
MWLWIRERGVTDWLFALGLKNRVQYGAVRSRKHRSGHDFAGLECVLYKMRAPGMDCSGLLVGRIEA